MDRPARIDQHNMCIYCNVSFSDKLELRVHCQTEAHEMMIMSDEGRDWHWRPPPRGFKSESYRLCDHWKDPGSCRYGSGCVQAHGEEELAEWKERFHYREMKLQRAKEKELYGKSYTEELLEKWLQTSTPSSVMKERLEEVDFSCTSPLSTSVSSKNSLHEWIFFLNTKKPLKAVALLQDIHRNHFSIANITIKNAEVDIKNDQEWLCPIKRCEEYKFPITYTIGVTFKTSIFGTFRQSVVFDFFTEPVLVKHLCVDVIPFNDIDRFNEIRKEITLSIAERLTINNSKIIPFRSTLVSCGASEWENNLKLMYPCPQQDTFLLSHSTMTEKMFTINNYKERMHELLFVEEMARYDLIANYNLAAKLQITRSYILSPNSMAASTAKYSSNGELFASVVLGKELCEDTSEGRLILMHCNSVFLCPNPNDTAKERVAFEAMIEDKGRDTIYLRISSETVQQLKLKSDSELKIHIQFQLNRIPYCEWHYTLDKMPNFKYIFPETYLEPSIPWSPSRQWGGSMDQRLNLKQKEAIVAITTSLDIQLPPILIIGPFGTGKTFTLAQAIKELTKDSRNRILICTHSNSAADLYIKDYLDPWVEGGNANARPLRIYYQKRWVTTVNAVVQKYCLIKMEGGVRAFQIPTKEDILKHKIIVVTLSTSIYLSSMGLPNGYFTHILVDEAAQAIECETVTPLTLANDSTRIVLAGDHMQLGPDIFSPFARERNLHISLLERLYDHYPTHFPCKILLCENYRAHESLIQFTSESFYDQKLISSSKQPKHSKFYPLSFFTTRGEDVQDKNSTAFYNNAEVYEVVDRILELKRSWPSDWGPLNDQSIAVVTPYSDQVFRIRSELRKKRIDNVCVERVLNVQGKQFRAIVLSTVRTRRTCTNSDDTNIDYGFLSNSKLLNTAVTRAQSLVAVVGDPIALCSMGRCSKVWEKFLQTCHDNDSLFGITWTQLKCQLDGIELKKIYSLNPLAPVFVPRKLQEYTRPVEVEAVKDIILPSTSNFNPLAMPQVPFPVPGYPPFPLMYPPRPVFFNLPSRVPLLSTSCTLPNGFSPQSVRLVNPPQGITHPPINPSTHPPARPPPPPNLPTNLQRLPGLSNSLPSHPPSQSSMNIHMPVTSSNNKLIQFMNNVHFPEAQVLNDCINLLPENMSLADILLQPPNLQEQWYNYLKESAGIEAAEKFKYLLHTTNQKGSRISETNIFGRNTPQSCESPTFNWYDSPTNQLNFNKPVYMRENSLHDCNGYHLNHQLTNHNVTNQHIPDHSIPNHPTLNQGVSSHSILNQGIPNHSVLNQSALNHPILNQTAPNLPIINHNTPNHPILNQVASNHHLNNILNHIPNQNVNLLKQNLPNPNLPNYIVANGTNVFNRSASSSNLNNGHLEEVDVQRQINEEFANLVMDDSSGSDVADVFTAFSHKNNPFPLEKSQVGPRFYKYFH